jgi:Holliday junction resolvase RusA-like endonuclease
MTIAFTILGEPASKANSRKLVTIGGRPSTIKSEKARNYESDAVKQIPPRFRLQIAGPVRVTLRIFYASQRPDLDESVVLDVLQDRYKTVGKGEQKRRELVQKGVYVNDRQVREKHVFHGIDRANPRTEVLVEPLEAQQVGLELAMPVADPLEV